MERASNYVFNDEEYIQALLNSELDELGKELDRSEQNRSADRKELLDANPVNSKNSRSYSEMSDFFDDNVSASTIFKLIQEPDKNNETDKKREQSAQVLVTNSEKRQYPQVTIPNSRQPVRPFMNSEFNASNLRFNEVMPNLSSYPQLRGSGLGSYESLLKLDRDAYDEGKGFNSKDLDKMIVSVITPNNKNLTCNICQCELNIGEKYVILQCIHFYHEECIKNWLSRKKTCPICFSEVKFD